LLLLLLLPHEEVLTLVVLICPCRNTSVVKARSRAFRWSAARPKCFTLLPWRIMVHFMTVVNGAAAAMDWPASANTTIVQRE
jgi:hypothetical protein